jgi:hypothetical protein
LDTKRDVSRGAYRNNAGTRLLSSDEHYYIYTTGRTSRVAAISYNNNDLGHPTTKCIEACYTQNANNGRENALCFYDPQACGVQAIIRDTVMYSLKLLNN